MPACLDLQPVNSLCDRSGADAAEQLYPCRLGHGQHAMVQFCRMHRAAAVNQHAAAVKIGGDVVAGLVLRHHPGPGVGDIIQAGKLGMLPAPSRPCMRAEKRPQR